MKLASGEYVRSTYLPNEYKYCWIYPTVLVRHLSHHTRTNPGHLTPLSLTHIGRILHRSECKIILHEVT